MFNILKLNVKFFQHPKDEGNDKPNCSSLPHDHPKIIAIWAC